MIPAPESNGHANGNSSENGAEGTLTTLPGPNHNWSIRLTDKVIASTFLAIEFHTRKVPH